MKKLYLQFQFSGYPKKDIYCLAYTLGRRLSDFLGKEIFSLLLDSKILLNVFQVKKLRCISDGTYKLHSAAKALEGFLLKVIKGKGLQEQATDRIGDVFGKKECADDSRCYQNSFRGFIYGKQLKFLNTLEVRFVNVKTIIQWKEKSGYQ